MKKKIIAMVLVIMMVCMASITGVFAVNAGESRVMIGNDLSEDQIQKIYQDFNLEQGSVKEMKVTNQEEREYLEDLVPDEKIGNVALSCVYITTLEEGTGLSFTIMNINWCTSEMYKNALETAGITDAKVMISAPHAVTGTAALTGIYKAYEDITGEKLSEMAKVVAAEELITTGKLGEAIGSIDAAQLVGELKKILDQTQNMTDDEVRSEIRRIASEMDVELSDEQVEQLLNLCRSLEGLSEEELEKKVNNIADTLGAVSKVGKIFEKAGEAISNFVKSVGEFFSNLFAK